MGALLRILSKDGSGTLCSRLYPIGLILSTEISIRQQDPDSVESIINIEEEEPKPTNNLFDENRLIIKGTDGSETTIDVNAFEACEFEINDDNGDTVIKTDSLFILEKGLAISHINNDNARNQAIKALNNTKT